KAEADALRAVKLLERLLVESPHLPAYHSELSRSFTALARLARLKGRPGPGEARILLGRAIEQLEAPLKADPDRPGDRARLARLRAERDQLDRGQEDPPAGP